MSALPPALGEDGIDAFLGATAQAPADDGTFISIQRFLTAEARMLDEEQYLEWLRLFSPGTRYWMPVMENRYRRDPVHAFSAGRMSFFDDTLETLTLRVRRLESGRAWPEDPPVRHIYAVSNVEAFSAESAGSFIAHSTFVSYRNKLDRDEATLIGRRRDLLVRGGPSGWLIERRLIMLGQSLLLSKNLNVFF